MQTPRSSIESSNPFFGLPPVAEVKRMSENFTVPPHKPRRTTFPRTEVIQQSQKVRVATKPRPTRLRPVSFFGVDLASTGPQIEVHQSSEWGFRQRDQAPRGAVGDALLRRRFERTAIPCRQRILDGRHHCKWWASLRLNGQAASVRRMYGSTGVVRKIRERASVRIWPAFSSLAATCMKFQIQLVRDLSQALSAVVNTR